MSMYNQMIAKIEVSGRDARIAAIGEYFLPISETPTITKAVSIVLIKYCMKLLYIIVI